MKVDLDNLNLVAKLDPSDMLGAIDCFPDAFLKHTNETNLGLKRPVSMFGSLVLMGMGGSASAADVILDWLGSYLRIPTVVHRQPGLPAFVDSRTIFIAISYSGQTSETLGAFRAAKKRGSRLIGIGTGGKLSDLCNQFDAPFIEVEPVLAPRAALGQLIVATATALSRLGLVGSTSREMVETGRELVRLRKRFCREKPLETNPAKRLASRLLGSLVVIYSMQRMSSVGRRFKNQLAENSKLVAKYDVLPEACHNEIESWHGQNDGLLPVIIRDWNESAFERSVVQAFRYTIRSETRHVPLEVCLPSRRGLSSLLTPIFFLDYVSVYLAILRRVDPTPTDRIVKYKERLRSEWSRA